MPIPFITGAAATSIPVILHMIHRRRAQRVWFPTIRFLKASNERTSRRQKIQDLLLLLMRMLLFFLCGMALDSQCNRLRGSRYAGLGRAVHAVILLDNSFSMGTVHEGTPRFQRAKELAMAAVDQLPVKSSQAALMLACPPAGAPRPILNADLAEVRQAIHQARLSQARADLTAAVERARKLLAEARDPAPTNEIYVLTDLQRNAWSPPAEHDQAAKKTADLQPSLVIADVGREDYRNVAVIDLAVRGGARVRGRPVTVQAKVHNFSPADATVNVTLYVDRTKQANHALKVPGNHTSSVSFSHAFEQAGIHTGWVQIGDDSLALDNRRDFCIEIQEHIPAGVFRDRQPGLAHLDPAFFIARALDPFADDPSRTAALVQSTVTDFAQISHQTLKRFKVVVLVDPGSLPKSTAAVLRRYVRRGGRLILFCGPSIRPKALNAFLGGDSPQKGLLPVTVQEPVQGVVERRDFKSLVEIDLDHPALRIFKDYRRLVQTVKVYNYAPVVVEHASPARILIGLSDGRPFLLENRFEQGRVLLFTTTTDPDWSNLGSGRFLVPLLHRLVYYLTEQGDVEGTHLVGAPVPIPLRDVGHPVTVRVRDPDGEVLDLPARPVQGVVQATLEQTDKRGPYVYLVVDPARPAEGPAEEAKRQAERGFVVNIDPDESDLARIPTGELGRLLGQPRVHFASSAESLSSAVETLRQGVPLRNLILFLVLFIAIFETFFANRIVPALQRSEEERPSPVGGPATPAPAES